MRTTVTIPAYNAEDTLRAAVESALGQTVSELEVVVIDDGSSVPVSELLADIRDERLRVLRHEENRGLGAARNTALAAVRTPFISQLDADDAWEPGYLEAVLPRFQDPAIGLVHTDAVMVRADGSLEPYFWSHLQHPIDHFPQLAELNPIAALTVTMRTDAVRAVGGYAGWLWGAQDYHLYMKLAVAGWRFAYVDRPLARYRYPHDHAAMSDDLRKVIRNDLKLMTAFKLRHPLTPGPGKRALSIAWTYIRRYTPVLSDAARRLRDARRQIP